ncbi:hypothetical protein E1A91_D10G061200v1 [Gossypium mustelinum]|uniref:Uncharacterized protein n=1 Tax=Gossypium mustelinum TaxID=34275 RepID=A0A5D2T552_GOSMU|nr:hypothetical protein E1A91_D10G061200v1 [Gossypium mustelinum]
MLIKWRWIYLLVMRVFMLMVLGKFYGTKCCWLQLKYISSIVCEVSSSVIASLLIVESMLILFAFDVAKLKEDINHALLQCSYARVVWDLLGMGLYLRSFQILLSRSLLVIGLSVKGSFYVLFKYFD